MWRWVFFVFLLSGLNLQGLQVQCPHGCGQREQDPKIVVVEELFENCLKGIQRKPKSPWWADGPRLELFGSDFSMSQDIPVRNIDPLYGYFMSYDWVMYNWHIEGGLDFKPWSTYPANGTQEELTNWGVIGTYQKDLRRFSFRAEIKRYPSNPIPYFSLEFYTSVFQMFSILKADVKSVFQCYLDLLDKETEKQKGILKRRRDQLRKWYEEDHDEIWLIEWDCKCGSDHCIDCKIRRAKEEIQFCNEQKTSGAKELSDHLNIIDEARLKIDAVYRSIYDSCIQNHQNPWAYYQRGLLSFHQGIFDEALEDVAKLIDAYQKPELAETLPSEVYFHKGSIESEIGLYHDAILSLTQSIEQNPKQKDAYFERAVAYFETGEFDLALKDYLATGFKNDMASQSFSIDYASGLVDGIKKGIEQELGDLFPAWAPIMSCGLWALTNSPTPSAKFVTAAMACVGLAAVYVASDQIVTELKELVTNWDALSDQQRGECSGYIIGKYGIDIFAAAGSVKLMEAYRDLKKANNLLTFEIALADEANVAQAKATELLSKKKQFKGKNIETFNLNKLLNDTTKMGHLFDAKHNLNKLGNKRAVLEKITQAVFEADIKGKIPKNEAFEIAVIIEKYEVVVRGKIVNGELRYGTFFIPE